MKSVTVTMDDEVACWARIEAARQDMSLSRFIGELLRERMASDVGYEGAMRRYLSRPPVRLSDGPGDYPSRDELHER